MARQNNSYENLVLYDYRLVGVICCSDETLRVRIQNTSHVVKASGTAGCMHEESIWLLGFPRINSRASALQN